MMSADEAGAGAAVSVSTGCAAIRTSECPATESLAIRDSKEFSDGRDVLLFLHGNESCQNLQRSSRSDDQA
jgi:ribonuclease HII